ncbi:polyketide synthetase [Lecanicillium sp. MT-2017a]|nr:polyketide synthetase [Lecanicillium sp. MT-2017a]
MDALNELCSTFNVFSKAFKACCDAVDKHLDFQLVRALEDDKLRDRTDFAQSALFVFEVAMFRLLESFNIHPDFVTGHSLGEVVAAHAAGALSLDSAATIVTARAKLMAGLPPNGGMASISATEKEVSEELSQSKSTAVIAVVNSHNSIVVSGTEDAVKAIANKFESKGRRTTVLQNIKHGFHSPLMDDILPDLEKALESPLRCAETASVPLVSTVTGQQEDAVQLSSSKHWIRHVREPVQFAAAVDELRLKQDVSLFVEVGPSSMLSTHVTGAISTHGTVDRLLNTIGQIWTRGISVNWSAVFEGSGGRFVSLPVYAFQRQKYWLPYNPRSRTLSREATPGQGTAGVPGSELGHGILINSTSILGTGSIICFGSLSKARQPWLWDHIISGQSLLPATAFAELAMRAGMECEYQVESESMELEELAVVKPLILSSNEEDFLNKEESEEVQVQVLVGEPQTTGNGTVVSRDVSVYSRPSGVAARHEWTRHATGTLKQSPIASNTKMRLENDTNRTDSESDVNVPEMYKVLADAGIYYGQPFQAIRSIWRLEGEDLLVHIDPPHKSSDNSSFIIHPAVLDAALHASVIASGDKVGTGGIKLPFSMRGFQIFAKPDISDSILSTVSHLGEDRIRVSLANKSTSVVFAEIDEVHLRAWKSDIAGGDLYRLEWVQSVSESAVSDSTTSIYEKFRVPGSGSIEAAGVSQAVHDAIAEALHVIHERRATLTSAFSQDVLVFVTERASSVGNRSDIDVVAAAVWGFVRSAQAEFGGDRIMLVDLDGSTESEAALPVAIASGQETIALQSGTMMVPKLVKQPPVLDASQSSTLDVRGTVLITGGTGGLGAILSRYLVHTYGAKKLILASRSGMKAPTARELYSELSDAGATVRVEACDISNREELAVILSTIHPLPPITSIIHCAGVVDDALLSWQTSERISQVLRPKVDGAWNLHELMPSTVHSFILFSSYVSILGNEGQAAYTAGNSFLDALARFRVARGLPALSLAWGPWANDEGMAAPGKLVAPNPRVANAQPVTDEQGMQLFFRALQVQAKTTPPEPVIVPMLLRGPFPLVQTVDFLAKQKDVSPKPHTESEATWRQSLVGVSIEDRHDILLALLKEEVAAVLGYQKDILLPDRPLVELGFDSFTSVLLTNRLKILTGFSSIPVTLALDYDTLQALVQYLLARFDAEPVVEVVLGSDVPSTPSCELEINDRVSGTTENVSPTADIVLPIRAAEDGFNPDTFRGLSPLYKQLSDLGYYTAAIDLLAAVASGMSGERDVFELSHPEGYIVPEDHGALAELHLCTIRKHFSNRKGIILAGYSAGGTVAYAVASKLVERGGLPRLAGFIMIDTYLNMVGRGDPEWLSALPAEALSSRLAGPRVDDSDTAVSESLVGDIGLALAKAGGYFKTFTDWNADSYPLPNELQTLFIRARDRSEKMPEDKSVWRAKWPLAKKTVDVPGTHLALLDKSFAPAISEEIQEWAKENLG